MSRPHRLQKHSRSSRNLTVTQRLLLITAVAVLALAGVGISHSAALKGTFSPPAANAGFEAVQPVGKTSAASSNVLTFAGLKAKRAKPGSNLSEPLAFLNPIIATITASKTDALLVDNDLDTKADPGDTLRYTVTIGVSGMDATGVMFSDTVDPNTAFVAGSLRTTPLARPDSYTATGNVRITKNAAAGVLINDQDFDGVGGAVSVTAGTFLSANNGNVTISADGSFTYNPPPGFEGNDTFTYTLNDNDTPNTTDTGTVTVAVSGMFWFVNSSASCPCDGRLTNPFNLLTGAGSFAAVAADDPGDNIFLYTGSYTGGLTLLDNQRLIGQGAGASLQSITGITPPTGSDSLPSTGGTRPTVANAAGSVVLLGAGNYLRGFDIGNSAVGSSGITGTNIGTLTVTEMLINGTGRAMNLDTGTLAATFDSITSTNSTTNGIRLNNVGGIFTISGATTVTNPTQTGITIANVSDIGTPSFQFGAVTINSRNTTGILLDNVDNSGGTMSFGAITIPNPNNAGGYGLRIQNSAALVSVASATISDANIVTPQADAAGFPGSDGDGDAIFLTNNPGSFTLNGGTLSNCGNDCIDLRNSSTLVLTNVNISSPGLDVTGATGAGAGGHGISAINLTGASSIAGGIISGFNTTNRDGIYLLNDSSTALTLTVQGTTFQNSTGNRGFSIRGDANANMNITVGGPTNNVATNCTFQNILGTALQSLAGGSAGSTATVNLTVRNSTFQNSPLNGKTNLIAGLNEAGKSNVVLTNNTFNNVFITASTGESLININNDGTLAGNQLGLNMTGNNINGVGSALNTCGGAGTAACRGPLNAILVFLDDAANVPTTLVIDNNTLSNVQQGGINLDMANTGGPSSTVSAKIINNCIGRLRVGGACSGAIAGVGIGAAVTVQSGIRVERRRNNSLSSNVLISNNQVRNGAGGPGNTLNGPGIFARTKANANMSVTVTNNTVDTNLTGGVAEMRFDTNPNDAGDILSPTQCDDITGNAIPAGGQIEINEINTGTHNVEQASAVAVAAANPSAAVMADPGVSFGVPCALPPAAADPADSIIENPAPVVTSGRTTQRPLVDSTTALGSIVAWGGSRLAQWQESAAITNHRDSLKTSAAVRSGNSQPRLTDNPTVDSRPKRERNDGAVLHHSAAATTAAASRPNSPATATVADVAVNIGVFPAGKSITVTFDVTVDNPLDTPTLEVCNQGTVTADGPISVLTDDPSVGGSTDPTCTPLDQPDVTVAVAPSSVLEDGPDNLVYTFTREGSTNSALTVNFSVAGTASSSTDYAVTGAATFDGTNGTVSIPIGSSTVAITVNPTTDITVEADETVIVNVTAGTFYDVGVPGSASGTITNDDTDVSVAVAPSSTSEDGAGNLVYTFTRVGVTSGALTVNFSVGGAATFNTDYIQTGAATFTPPTGTVSFGAGNSTATVTIDPTPDTTVEPDETVILAVAAGTGYNVAAVNNSATGTITNDDTDVSIAVAPTSVAEDGATNLVYTFTRVGVTSTPLTVNFTIGGTAIFSTDYTQVGAATFVPPNGTVTFGAGNSTATVIVDPSADITSEPDDTVILTLAAGTGYNVVEPSSATGTITNDDVVVSVAVSPGAVDEDGVTNLVYTFTRNDSNGALTANFSIGGTATFNTDYTQTDAATFVPPNGTVSFAAGSLTTTVTIDPVADSTVEPDDTIILTVVAGAGYGVGAPSSATGTITNDDTDVSVAVAPSSTSEDGAGNLVYTFTRAGVTSGALTVNFSIGGTAVFNTDYTQTDAATFTPPNGTVSFAAGSSTATVTIDPTPDTAVESDETVILTVAAGTGYNVAAVNNSATGTITNDDTEVSLAVAPSSVAEDGATNLVYTFTRVGVTSGGLTVNFTIGGTAIFNTDYTQVGAATFVPPNGTVTFVAGNSTATVTVNPSADISSEPDETVILTVAAGTGYNVGTPSAATGTIANDDAADVEITAKTDTPDPVCVGQNITYTIGFRNNGPGPTVNAKVSDTIPANTTFVSATLPAGWSRADSVVAGGTGTLMFTKASVTGGETASFTVVVNISSGTIGGTIISNTATASSDFPDDVPGNNSKTALTTVDPTPPTISTVTANPASLWPPNHKMRDVAINYTATDTCPGTVNCSITNITSNEPVNGAGDGDAAPDWEFVDNHNVRLRAEHTGGGTGRIYTITVTCTDAAGNTSSKTVEVHVGHNIIGPTSGSSFKINSPVSFSGTFWDIAGRTHSAQWQFDSLTTGGTIVEPSGSRNGTVKGSYTFREPGVYKVTLKVTDNTGVTSWVDTQNDLEAIVVIYDPDAGYTIGGGWIASLAGAFTSDPNLIGKLSFGFNSKYFKNATNPKGEAQVEFKLGEFEFNALNYEYLAISGSRAQFRGFGKVNGAAGYDFILTVIDAGGSEGDKFRIKIWNKTTGVIVFDTQMGQSDAADPTTAVGTGSSIVIKK